LACAPARPAVIRMSLTNADMKTVLKASYRLLTEHKLHVPTLFWGPSGIGKTAAIPQAAAELEAELGQKVRAIIVKPGQADSPGDIIGMPEKVDYHPCPFCLQASEPSDEYTRAALTAHCFTQHNVQTWTEVEAALVQFGDRTRAKQRFALTDIWPTAGNAILCIDEVNRAGPDIRNTLFGLINERKLELADYTLPPTVKRFVHFHVLPTPEEWLEHMREQPESQSEAGTKALSFFSEHREFVTPTDAENPVLEKIQAANRTCTMLVRLSNVLSGRLLSEAASGTLGAKAAVAFMQHMAKQEQYLKAKDLLAHYPKFQDDARTAIKEGRQDMFSQTQEDLFRHLAKRQKPLTTAEVGNLVLYLKDLLADNVWSLLAGLLALEKSAKATDPIKRHVSALFKERSVNELLAQHEARVSQVVPA
jgi:hypothetical protein